MDLIRLFNRCTRGYSFVLVLVDYATQYPEAVPLHTISAKSVAQALFQIISQVGIPKEILTDQGTSFMSRTLWGIYGLLGIKSIRTSVYSPQTDNLVECLNKTLKSMIHKFVHEDGHNWDRSFVFCSAEGTPGLHRIFSKFVRTPRGGGLWTWLKKAGRRGQA